MSTIDIDRVRAETPGCEKIIHFNNAGASLPPEPVYRAVTRHLALERRIGGYEAEERARDLLEGFYTSFAGLLHCDPREIAYVENATRAWDMLFYSVPLRKGDVILTSRAEYVSNYLAFLHRGRRCGAVVEVVPDDETGQVSLEAMEKMIDARVKLIALTHVPTQGGLVNPAADVGKIARKHGILYLLDACQSVGQIPLDVEAVGCDMLSGTGRKFLRGPRGTGYLYVRRSLIDKLDPPFIDLHSATWIDGGSYEIRKDARRFENWESYVAGRVGLAAAVDYAMAVGIGNICRRVKALARSLRERLAEIPGVAVCDLGVEKSGIVTFVKNGESANAIRRRLNARRMNVSVVKSNSALLDMEPRGLKELVRASVHYYNTEDEIERFCRELASA
ncbi:MAG: aminotransferase class V-fold PLP-dependent enzyme [Acidobacteriota bacterium]|nr:aminotransferase class V-fold PLP-dependent enzyme [Acidobacteriota bacterium]